MEGKNATLIIDLYVLIPAVITQVFNPVSEIVIPAGIATIETQPVKEEANISKCSIWFKVSQVFLFCSY